VLAQNSLDLTRTRRARALTGAHESMKDGGQKFTMMFSQKSMATTERFVVQSTQSYRYGLRGHRHSRSGGCDHALDRRGDLWGLAKQARRSARARVRVMARADLVREHPGSVHESA
jgi:hypothetical protein